MEGVPFHSFPSPSRQCQYFGQEWNGTPSLIKATLRCYTSICDGIIRIIWCFIICPHSIILLTDTSNWYIYLSNYSTCPITSSSTIHHPISEFWKSSAEMLLIWHNCDFNLWLHRIESLPLVQLFLTPTHLKLLKNRFQDVSM